jgi:hypothetical protein
MRFAGNLFYETDEGERHLLTEFDLEAADAATARTLILDQCWDHRLDSACFAPIIKYTVGPGASGECTDERPESTGTPSSAEQLDRAEPLDLLEQLLSLTEPFRDQMESAENHLWGRISAEAADLREAEGA